MTNLPTKAIEAAVEAFKANYQITTDMPGAIAAAITAAAPFMGPRVRWDGNGPHGEIAYAGPLQIGKVLCFPETMYAVFNGETIRHNNFAQYAITFATLDLAKSAVEDAFAKALAEGETK